MNELEVNVSSRLADAGITNHEQEARRIVAAAEAESGNTVARAMEMVDRRLAGKPLEYAIGRVSFMGIEMLAGEGALVPRAETEILGKGAARRIGELHIEGEIRIIDMCCGAGNLACALATLFPTSRVWGSDLTDGCVSVARRNVEFLGLNDRVQIRQGDLFADLCGLGLEGTVDAVVCNPPYISSSRLKKDRAELLEHEPVEAFDGGPYGLTIHQRVLKDALAFLRPGGLLAFEFGLGQERQIELLFRRAKQYDGVVFDNDAEGNARAVFTHRRGE